MMNAIQYKEVLENRAIPQMNEWFAQRHFVFMHDSAPCHKTKSVTQFLKNQSIDVLLWPANPDLNLIENVWAVVKASMLRFSLSTKQAVISKLLEVWRNNDVVERTIRNSIKSMPRRIEAVIKAKGGITKY